MDLRFCTEVIDEPILHLESRDADESRDQDQTADTDDQVAVRFRETC